MSWLFGYFGNTNQKQFASPESPLYSFKDTNLILFAGGNKQTCSFKSESSSSCWIVSGIGLKSADIGYKILDTDDWDLLLSLNPINLKSVNGHFVVLKYSENGLKFFTDELGLREIHIVKLNNAFGFTTRIDWLKYFIKPEIDFKEFGSRWLLQNQISRSSLIKNVIRLVCADATIKNNSLLIERNIWQPDFEAKNSREIFDVTLKKLLSVENKKISLSLSGGLDSRLLLSYLETINIDEWDTHTFGDPNHPDSKIAFQLLKSLKKENEIINDELPAQDQMIKLIKEYSVQSIVTNPASSIINLRFYDRLTDRNRIVIDGGFGEIWRRAFANRLLILGKNSILKKDAVGLFSFLRYNRADIFTSDAIKEMETGIIGQFDELFSEMLDANQISPEKWIDLFSIRSRLMNYYAPEQIRVDNFVVSFMPLVQRDILNLLFNLRESEKKNGKLFKQLIKKNASQLTKFPLVKGNIVHPFNSSSLGARLHSRIKNRLGLSYQSKSQIDFLKSLKEFIGDIAHSADARNFEYYDSMKIEKMMNDYLSNEDKYNSGIDWFLSFELFRKGILYKE
ncbi:MAG: hypothetical protein IPM14_11280 [bacterium]|nr:hypothetical protein [bacterium]